MCMGPSYTILSIPVKVRVRVRSNLKVRVQMRSNLKVRIRVRINLKFRPFKIVVSIGDSRTTTLPSMCVYDGLYTLFPTRVFLDVRSIFLDVRSTAQCLSLCLASCVLHMWLPECVASRVALYGSI